MSGPCSPRSRPAEQDTIRLLSLLSPCGLSLRLSSSRVPWPLFLSLYHILCVCMCCRCAAFSIRCALVTVPFPVLLCVLPSRPLCTPQPRKTAFSPSYPAPRASSLPHSHTPHTYLLVSCPQSNLASLILSLSRRRAVLALHALGFVCSCSRCHS